MRSITTAALSCAALASALVLPGHPGQSSLLAGTQDDQLDDTAWQILHAKNEIVSVLGGAANRAVSAAEKAVYNVEASGRRLHDKLHDDLISLFDLTHDDDSDNDDGDNDDKDGHDHDHSDLTIYQLIHKSNHTTKFAEIVDGYSDVVKLLNSTKANYTLFVPVNDAFKDIPEDHEKPSKDFIEGLLKYHVGIGEYSAKRILGTYTLPTALNEKLLGDEPQRLRTSVGLRGIKVNFYSKVVAANIQAKNGLIHAVDHIILPPTFAGKEINLLPNVFSTLLLAYKKTEFVKFIHGVKTSGSTVFAPSNKAWERLGLKANAFLFNTETGLKYLEALLKYQFTLDTTLYSDAFYDHTGRKDSEPGVLSEHYDLPTTLDDARISVDISRFAGFASIRINGFTHVSVHDGVAKNGVIHVVDRVPIPARKHGKTEEYVGDAEIEVEELKERLNPYISKDAILDL